MSLVVIIAGLAFSIILHEVAHGWVAEKLGDPTARVMGRLTLNPIAHIDPFMTLLLPFLLYLSHLPVFGAAKPVPVNFRNLRNGRRGMAMVAAAGPATNLVIAIVLAVIARIVPSLFGVLAVVVVINLALMTFNLIPFPPLDGSRIVYAFVPPVRQVYDRLERLGIIGVGVIVIGLGYLGLFAIIAAIVSILASALLGQPISF